jgi:hypothetical protein
MSGRDGRDPVDPVFSCDRPLSPHSSRSGLTSERPLRSRGGHRLNSYVGREAELQPWHGRAAPSATHTVLTMLRSRRELLGWNNWACRQSFGRPYLEHQPSEEQRVGKDDE